MPYGSRNQQRMQAKITRITGTLAWLLIPAASTPSTDTPLSISSDDVPVNLSTAKLVPIYATIIWKPGLFTYGEGGKTLMKVAQVEIPFDYSSFVVQAYAVKLASGEILVKKTQDINESQTAYILTVESSVATVQ